MTDREIRDIQLEKGATFTVEFIKNFDREWGEIREAARRIKERQGGSDLIWFGLNWSLELYQQANARLHRQGQKHTVYIHHLAVADSVDEDVIAALQKKGDCQAALLEALKARIEKYMQVRQEESLWTFQQHWPPGGWGTRPLTGRSKGPCAGQQRMLCSWVFC